MGSPNAMSIETASNRKSALVFLLLLLQTIGCVGYQPFTIQPKTWRYKNASIGYDESRGTASTRRFDTDGDDDNDVPKRSARETTEDPVLLLNGFGVGSFHQHRLIPHLLSNLERSNNDEESSSSSRRIIYGIDYLGQGRSWPVDCDDGNAESERGLIYSIDTWADQIISFIEEVILPEHDGTLSDKDGTKVHLIGNSVGG
mmetsp:Transcript_61172/g.72627  ORF Transcript_61172/g.72627 Transcript_61172/m.72627 type:complete len:201 (-) Transcript_61172:27-629(-)